MAQAPIQFDRASGALVGANAWERLAAMALTLGSKVGAHFSHRGYNMCANLLRTMLPARGIQVKLNPDAIFEVFQSGTAPVAGEDSSGADIFIGEEESRRSSEQLF